MLCDHCEQERVLSARVVSDCIEMKVCNDCAQEAAALPHLLGILKIEPLEKQKDDRIPSP